MAINIIMNIDNNILLSIYYYQYINNNIYYYQYILSIYDQYIKTEADVQSWSQVSLPPELTHLTLYCFARLPHWRGVCFHCDWLVIIQ